MTEEKLICCICGKEIKDDVFGNNPYPIKNEGVCCQQCNLNKVIPARIGLIKEQRKLL